MVAKKKNTHKGKTCPICENPYIGGKCICCGYDISIAYEEFGSISPVQWGTLSQAGLTAERNRKLKHLLSCKSCGAYSFSVSKDGTGLYCDKCGTITLHPAWSALDDRIKRVETEITRLQTLYASVMESGSVTTSKGNTVNPPNTPSPDTVDPSLENAKRSIASTILSAGGNCAILKSRDRSILWRTASFESSDNMPKNMITASAGGSHAVFLLESGKAYAVGSSDQGQCSVQDWTDLKAVSAGTSHSVGLKKDGSVVAIGGITHQQCSTNTWKNVTHISAGGYHTLGLLENQKVVGAGNNSAYKGIETWTDIIAISAGEQHSLGLRANGKVVAAGVNPSGCCNVDHWNDVIQISAGHFHSVGLKADGTVVAVGMNYYGQCEVKSWESVISVSAGDGYTIGLREDGRVYVCGKVPFVDLIEKFNLNIAAETETPKNKLSVSKEHQLVQIGLSHIALLKPNGSAIAIGDKILGQCNVDGWENIHSVALGSHCTFGLKKDGTVLYAGNWNPRYHLLSSIRTVVSISAGNNHVLCLHDNGRVSACGDNSFLQCDVSKWRNVVRVFAVANRSFGLLENGNVLFVGHDTGKLHDVEKWENIVDISPGSTHVAGLTKAGTVCATGMNAQGQCYVYSWHDVVQIATGFDFTIGLQKNGCVYGTGEIGEKVNSWRNIKSIAAGATYAVGLRNNGSAVYAGNNTVMEREISSWSSISQIYAGPTWVIGLTTRGDALGVGSVPMENQTKFTYSLV